MSEQKAPPQVSGWEAFTPADSPKTPLDVMADEAMMALATPKVEPAGPAYDFSSKVYDFATGRQQDTGRVFNLLEAAREKPVALIFGSYT